jgi:hypothetical protein
MKTMWNMLFSPAGAEAHGGGSIASIFIDTVITGRFLKGTFS